MAERAPRLLLARDPRRRPGLAYDRWLDEEALALLRDLGVAVEAPDAATPLRDWLWTGSVVVAWSDDYAEQPRILGGGEQRVRRRLQQRGERRRPDRGRRQRLRGGRRAGSTCAPPSSARCASRRRSPPACASGSRRGRGRTRHSLDRRRQCIAGSGMQSRPDLSDDLTVFVLTVGAPSFAECLQRLDAQDCRFRREVIDHVAPMSAALQAMLDRCRTPYFVQVDEDMLLYPHAVRTLYERIAAAPANVAMVVAWLLDAHLDRPVQGVKIFRHAIAARYPFADDQSFEVAQLDRMRADGFPYVAVPHAADWRASPVAGDLFGLHGTHWTPRSIFERYATYERARHARPRSHDAVRGWTTLFLERVLTTGSELDLFALLGVLAARLADDEAAGAKDFRHYPHLTGFAGARAFLDELARRRG
ncbi:MAG: hypothetical protein U0802_02060 [Candidatus Binatia bacterium]